LITRPASFQRQGDAQRLEQRQTQRAVTRVLGDLAAAGFAFLLQLLERGHHVGQQLHDDRRRDVRHDPQREHREARQRTTREHVEQAQDAALLALEELLQLGGSMPGTGICAPMRYTTSASSRNTSRRRRSPNLPVFAS
jgi:hypothetical protein